MDMRSPFPNALVAASLLVALLSFGCGSPSPSGGGGSESPNQQEGEVIREALAWADGLELGGYTDWRLPDARELQTPVDITTVTRL